MLNAEREWLYITRFLLWLHITQNVHLWLVSYHALAHTNHETHPHTPTYAFLIVTTCTELKRQQQKQSRDVLDLLPFHGWSFSFHLQRWMKEMYSHELALFVDPCIPPATISLLAPHRCTAGIFSAFKLQQNPFVKENTLVRTDAL